jgi:hypothetical protein
MPATRRLHIGGINIGKERAGDALEGSRKELIYELNCMLFDYFYANSMEIKQLPPLDDWAQSIEDSSYWGYTFPETEITVWIRSELIEFK